MHSLGQLGSMVYFTDRETKVPGRHHAAGVGVGWGAVGEGNTFSSPESLHWLVVQAPAPDREAGRLQGTGQSPV